MSRCSAREVRGVLLSGGGTIEGTLTVNLGGIVSFAGCAVTVKGAMANNGLFILRSGATLGSDQAFFEPPLLRKTSKVPARRRCTGHLSKWHVRCAGAFSASVYAMLPTFTKTDPAH